MFVMQAAPTVIWEIRGVGRMPWRSSPVLGSRNERSWFCPLVVAQLLLLLLLEQLLVATSSSSHHLNGDCVVH